MDHLSEIEDRLMRGVVVICELGKASGNVLDRERLLGKAEGVNLALGWVREQMALQAAAGAGRPADDIFGAIRAFEGKPYGRPPTQKAPRQLGS